MTEVVKNITKDTIYKIMNGITVVVLIFSILGAADYLFGNKIGIGKEFQKAFSLFCPMALSMIGMLVVAPALGVWLMPAFEGFYRLLGIDPSILPACLFANDMGGMQLAQSVCKTPWSATTPWPCPRWPPRFF